MFVNLTTCSDIDRLEIAFYFERNKFVRTLHLTGSLSGETGWGDSGKTEGVKCVISNIENCVLERKWIELKNTDLFVVSLI